ncbi:ATP-binding protein [Candidatus Micrarchaeota archaeon]|nr:ATP-binding protein [Candidatus Micrarchaeota archaeon]
MDDGIIEELRLVSLSLLNSIALLKERRIVGVLLGCLKEKPRIKLLKGFRGVGKTTALLQVFGKGSTTSFYFSADSLIIKSNGIYAVGRECIKRGHSALLIDEVHTYPGWRSEIKALHDEFPNAVIIASGSAPLAFNPERREETIDLREMAFDEYFYLKNNVKLAAASEGEWSDKNKALSFIASNEKLEGEFYNYVKTGGFPLSLDLSEEKSLNAIYNSVRKSVHEDAVCFLKMSKEKVFAMERLLVFLATSPPGELSVTSLSSNLMVSKTIVYEIINALEAMQIIRMIRPFKRGMALARAEPKLLFYHPNLRHAVCRQLGKTADAGAVREELAVFAFSERNWNVHTIKGMKKSPDYILEKPSGETIVVEIGGEKKKRAQLKGFEKGVVITEYQLIPLLIVAKKPEKA